MSTINEQPERIEQNEHPEQTNYVPLTPAQRIELLEIRERNADQMFAILTLRLKLLERKLLKEIAFAKSTAEHRVTVSDLVREAVRDLILQSGISSPLPAAHEAVAVQPKA